MKRITPTIAATVLTVAVLFCANAPAPTADVPVQTVDIAAPYGSTNR